MPPGVLVVASRLQNATTLTPEKLCDWYENTHIDEVTALSGVPCAARYEGLQPSPDPKAYSLEAPWLTVYEMPDVDFRKTKEFKSLDGQSPPKKEMLEGVFKQARFDTRFYEEVQYYEKQSGARKGPGTLLLSAAVQPREGGDEEFDRWYREEHLEQVSKAPGYKIVDGTVLDRFERKEPPVPKYLALHEFDSAEFPMKELGASTMTEWTKKVMGAATMTELGMWRLKRIYGNYGSEGDKPKL